MLTNLADPSSPLSRWSAIPLATILGDIRPEDCELHCATWNGENQPLEVFARSWNEWVDWNRWRPEHDVFNRPYIFSLMQAYTVELLDHPVQAWVGRLKVAFVQPGRNTGKSYVGSACGDTGIWARWGQYVATGHGGNIDLRGLVEREGVEYVREHFTFALLEYWSMRTPDDYVIERESYWKRVLLSREFGYNAN